LTPGEQGLWLLQRMAPDLGVTNVAIYWDLPGPPRWWPLREAFSWLVARHPALRSCFPMRGETPVRMVRPAEQVEVDLDVVDVEPDALESALQAYAGRPFDLDGHSLARLGLFRVGAERHCLCLAAHHLVVDAASLDWLLRELRAGYDSLAATGVPPDLPSAVPAPPLRPRDESVRFWRQRLAGFEPAGNQLATGPIAGTAGAPDAEPTFAGGDVLRVYPRDIAEAVTELRSRCRGTHAAVLLTAYLLALRYQGAADDLVVGALIDTRRRGHGSDVGYRVATVPLRVTVSPEATFTEFAAAVGEQLLLAMDHADVPFEMLAQEFAASHDDPLWWRHGLVRHAFNCLPPREAWQQDGPPATYLPNGFARFNLELMVEPAPDSISARLMYSTEIHDQDLAETILDRLASAVRQAYDHPQRPVGDFDLRTLAEIALEDAVNDTSVEWDEPATVPGLIAAIAAAHPDATAVVDGDRQFSYRQLVGTAAAVKRLLHNNGVGRGDLVAVAGPRSVALAAAVLGVWSAGAAYLPLDAEHPEHRLRHELDDAGCRIILDGHLLPAPVRAGRICRPVPRGWSGGDEEDADEPVVAAPSADDLAYVIYTSGSTGAPKGVRLTHGNLANVVRHFVRTLGADRGTSMMWLTTFAFDISVLELCLPLVAGGRVVVAPDQVRAVPERLLELVKSAQVSVVQATPTTWRLVAPRADRWLSDCDLLCGGEPLTPSLARQLRSAGRRAFNVYGPTETTIWSTVAELTAEEVDRVTVGRPIANTRAFLLDPRGRPVPPGVDGELCVAGAGVAQGYHGQPDLTARRFPTEVHIGRYYRTGDLGRMLPDGRIELLGRRDRQVKLRAHRIELTEVEGVLAEHDEVRAAAVVLYGDPVADGYLAAYLVGEERPGLVEEVWTYARSRLPGYSVPSRMVVVDDLPQTPNGKVDLTALAKREPPVAGAAAAEAEPAGDGMEAELVQAWRDVLRRPTLGRHANFFLNGGTSIMAVRLAATATARCGLQVGIGLIFRAPTPEALARFLRAGSE